MNESERWKDRGRRIGEQRYLAELYERYAPSVAKFFANRRFSPEDVKDLTQSTFLSAFLKLDELRDPKRFEAWLFKIACNKWRNTCRDQAKYRDYIQPMPAYGQLEGARAMAEFDSRGHDGDPLRNALVEEEHRLLRDAIAELSPSLRNVTLLRLDQDLSYQEIATVLRIPIGTVKSRLNSATEQLRRSLGDAYGAMQL